MRSGGLKTDLNFDTGVFLGILGLKEQFDSPEHFRTTAFESNR